MGIALILSMNVSAFAASTVGAVAGYGTTGSTTMGSTYATGTTTCAANTAGCTVVTHYTYYYTDSNNVAHRVTVTQSGAGGGYANATARGSGNDVVSISASSDHVVTYQNQMWSATTHN